MYGECKGLNRDDIIYVGCAVEIVTNNTSRNVFDIRSKDVVDICLEMFDCTGRRIFLRSSVA